ncbi:MAG: hypothetical protein ILO42_02920 [Clostridia bacterium]|nr:hypothetical protein [Clostridia bacterium]
MTDNNNIRRTSRDGRRVPRLILAAAAFALALAASFTVYGTVIYDSSKDPVVAWSAMEKFVGEQIGELREEVDGLRSRLELVELTGGGSGGGGGLSSAGAEQILSRISALEAKYEELKSENSSLKSQLDSAKKEINSLVSELQSDVSSLETEIGQLSDSLDSLYNSVTTVRSDVSTLSRNFSQISSISTKLETLTYKVNALTSADGDIAKLKSDLAELTEQFSAVAEEAGRLFTPVYRPYGAVVTADGEEGSALVILRAGSAEVLSPFNAPATRQGLNDLSDGSELFDGDRVPIYHNLLIPRGDGRGIRITSVDGAYIMIGGRFTIVGQ